MSGCGITSGYSVFGRELFSVIGKHEATMFHVEQLLDHESFCCFTAL